MGRFVIFGGHVLQVEIRCNRYSYWFQTPITINICERGKLSLDVNLIPVAKDSARDFRRLNQAYPLVTEAQFISLILMSKSALGPCQLVKLYPHCTHPATNTLFGVACAKG